MVTEKSPGLIQAAVKSCLARCYRGHTPLGVMAEFIGELRSQGWEEEDLEKVGTAVRKVLAGVIGGQESDDDIG